MCGIFGSVFVDPRVVDARAALASIAHRGPDGQGIWRGDDVVLGHRRLAVIDLTPAAAQPMTSDDGAIVVTYNGEIYNHHELREELERMGRRFRSRSDTEVLVEGYRAWGDRVVERVDGMFAFAIWDSARRRLLVARDRTGKKPVFFVRDGKGLRFASEMKALIASGCARAASVRAIPLVLALGYVPPPLTVYEGIEQLPPATTLVLEQGREPVLRRYWRAPWDAPRLRIGEEDAERELRRLMDRAVARRLESDVPLGAFLSGGIDSTIVVGLMARRATRPVRTFSIGFVGDPRYDETSFAREAARAFCTDHTEFSLEPASFDLVERLVDAHDGPFGDASAVPTSVVSRLAREHVTVALSGDGGDELFCGYSRLVAADAAERVPSAVRSVVGRLARLAAPPGERARLVPRPSRARLPRASRVLRVASLPLADRMLAWIAPFAFDLDRILSPEMAQRVDTDAAVAWNRALVAELGGATPLARVLAHNFATYLPYDLLVKADRCSMLHALEVRSPFLDTALVEFAARLPDGLQRRGRTTKWLLKRAFRDLLPARIRRRGKMGFGMPLGTWFRTQLRDYIRDHLASSGARCHEVVRADYVRTLLEEHDAGVADHGLPLWLLLTLEIWLRRVQAT
jgi:asparagine synthase (glutamine-hydrolysing)